MTLHVKLCRRLLGALLLNLSLVNAVLDAKVKTVVGANIDFASYKTYQWLPVKALTNTGVVEDPPDFGPAIREAVNRELSARGMKEVKEGGDLQVSTAVLKAYSAQMEAVIFPGGIPLDYATPIATMGRYNKEGTLVVNLIDSKTQKSAWAGLITQNLGTKPGQGLGKIPKASETLFEKYPVKKK